MLPLCYEMETNDLEGKGKIRCMPKLAEFSIRMNHEFMKKLKKKGKKIYALCS